MIGVDHLACCGCGFPPCVCWWMGGLLGACIAGCVEVCVCVFVCGCIGAEFAAVCVCRYLSVIFRVFRFGQLECVCMGVLLCVCRWMGGLMCAFIAGCFEMCMYVYVDASMLNFRLCVRAGMCR